LLKLKLCAASPSKHVQIFNLVPLDGLLPKSIQKLVPAAWILVLEPGVTVQLC
jgi:hypothetical protein